MKKILYLICIVISISLTACFGHLNVGLPSNITFGREGGEQKFTGNFEFCEIAFGSENDLKWIAEGNWHNDTISCEHNGLSICIVKDSLIVKAKQLPNGVNSRSATIHFLDGVCEHDYCNVKITQYNK